MKTKIRERVELSILRNLIVTLLVILFFLGVIILYYSALFTETRDNILLNGELNAVRAANQIDKYLYSGVDAIKLTGSTLDSMLREKRTQEEIQAYLEDQTYATAVVVSDQCNGIYGVINGEYLDGLGWVPDADFVPTERPWYLEAMARSGEVAVIDPYLDAQTGNVIITVAKMLCDGKSVVALDVFMNQLQTLTEKIAAHGNSDMEIVLDRSFQVVSHSDRTEVGKNYAAEDGSFGSVLVAKLRGELAERHYLSLNYGSAEYIVYAMVIENDWICVSVTDATAAFSRLRLPLMLTVVTAVLAIGILLLLMRRIIRKDAMAEKMRKLAAQQTEYAYCDQMTGLRNRRAYAEMVDQLEQNMPENCVVILFDVNGLKKMNDSLGHEAGDELITAAAACIRGCFEGIDTIYRIGGDEFCVILTDTEENAHVCLSRLDQAAAAWKGRYVDGFTVSYGVSSSRDCDGIDEVVKTADRRMYDCKSRYYRRSGIDRRSAGRE